MARRVITVAELARVAQVDIDEVLIRLWDSGLLRYKEPRDKIRRRDLDAAREAVGVPTKRELTDAQYWMGRLNLDGSEFRRMLAALGFTANETRRVLPRGAVAKLVRMAQPHDATPGAASPPQPPPQQEEQHEPLEWRIVGHERPIRCLSEEEVEGIHWELVRDFARDDDPIDPPGVRNRSLLGSAVFRQHTAYGNTAKYPTVEMAAAALFHAIVHDHPFHNGNKRTALVSLLVLLDENGVMLKDTCDQDELFELVVRLAQHKIVPRGREFADREVLHLAEWIRDRSRTVERGDRSIQWRKLKRILASFDCELTTAAGVGNRMNIARVISGPGRLGRKRRRRVATQVKYADDGRDATITTVKKIRQDLELDERHGVDSASFYRQGGTVPSAFIVKYRKTLTRLAKL